MIVVLMGVAGSGKTTVGKLLAKELGRKFYDADDYHPAANIEKIRKGIPRSRGV
jgi:carbohydrate kinase (thermoresistant glucokinase family)